MAPSSKSTQLPVSGHITVTREVTSDDDTELALEMLPVPVMTLCSPEPDQAWSSVSVQGVS